MSNLFADTMTGLLQAVNIERGNIPVEKVPDLPAETYRSQDYLISRFSNSTLTTDKS